MAKELLQRPEVSPARQEMRRKAVAKGMRSQRVWETKAPARGGHCSADEVRIERPAPSAKEQGRRSAKGIWALAHIILDRFSNCGNHGYDADFRALSDDSQRLADRQHCASQRQRFGHS